MLRRRPKPITEEEAQKDYEFRLQREQLKSEGAIRSWEKCARCGLQRWRHEPNSPYRMYFPLPCKLFKEPDESTNS